MLIFMKGICVEEHREEKVELALVRRDIFELSKNDLSQEKLLFH